MWTGERKQLLSRSCTLAMRLMEAGFIWNQISACLCHNRKGNWLGSSLWVAVAVQRCGPPPDPPAWTGTLNGWGVSVCLCVHMWQRGPPHFRACRAGVLWSGTKIHTKHPSLQEAAAHAADVLRGRHLAVGTPELQLTPSTACCCVVVMESSTNMAGI